MAVDLPPRAHGRGPTMSDVATTAGVSHQTVSRVLNDSPAVRPETRERVLAAISELGYRRNVAARALVTRRSQVLGLVSLSAPLYGPTSIVFGIEKAAQEAGYYLSIASEPSLDSLTLRRALGRLAGQGVEGVVVLAPQKQVQDAVAELSHDLPVVVVDGHDSGVPRVSVDHAGGAREVTAHLLAQGVRTVHHVTGHPDWVESDERVDGWAEALRTAGAEVPPPLVGDWSPASGYAAGLRLAADPQVEAVFVANDQMALGLIRACAETGRDVPGDLLVAGFDDVPEAAYYLPPLTTVRQDFATLGRRSVDLLVGQIDGGSVAPRTAVPTELVVRASSVRPPAGRSADPARRPRR